jgi:hypothetical protein
MIKVAMTRTDEVFGTRRAQRVRPSMPHPTRSAIPDMLGGGPEPGRFQRPGRLLHFTCAVYGAEALEVVRHIAHPYSCQDPPPRLVSGCLLHLLRGGVADRLVIQLEAPLAVRLGQLEPVGLCPAPAAAEVAGVGDVSVT